eukprot:m.262164 g.262164  ORF g.262164 m.262164 type:complete len:364 (-) comp44662_c0_seq1:59-1150(-)
MSRYTCVRVLLGCVLVAHTTFRGSNATPAYPSCATGLTCSSVTPPDQPTLTFDCAYIEGTAPIKGQLYFMHGNDGNGAKGMWFDMMVKLASAGFTGLACDARGYSPGAAPNNLAAYNYNLLVGDISSIVNATGYNSNFNGKFHIVSHDQGARVSWHAIALGEVRRRLLSFTSLSIPHSDVFSNALYGPTADPDQAEASQYVRMLVLPDAMSTYNGAVYNSMCKSDRWPTATACAPSAWWYNGAIDAGAMALAPLTTYDGPYGAVARYIGIPYDFVKNNTQYPITGVPQTVKVGRVDDFPVLYACGQHDSSDLCKTAFADETGALISKLTYVSYPECGHGIVSCGGEDLEEEVLKTILSAYGPT